MVAGVHQRERPPALRPEAVVVDLDRSARLDDAGNRAARREHTPRPLPARMPRVDAAGAVGRRGRMPELARGLEPAARDRPGHAALRAGEPLATGLADDRPRPQPVQRTGHDEDFDGFGDDPP
jgi:hypothetical protein